MKKITVLVIEDHVLFRETWVSFINANPKFEVLAGASSIEDGVVLAGKHHPDVFIIDIQLPGMDGIEGTGYIKERMPNAKILGVSLHNHPAYAKKMFQKGALGYVTKTSSSEELFLAIESVYLGAKFVCKSIKDTVSAQIISQETDCTSLLSPREIQIIGFVINGYSSIEIAGELQVAVKTVESHRHNIMRKLGVKNVQALVNYVNHSSLHLEAARFKIDLSDLD